MRASPIPVVGGSYADDNKPYTDQDTVGWIPTGAEGEGTRSAMFLKDAPGLQEFATVGTKHRGARDVEGKALVVSGTGLYQVNTTTGSAALRGTIPGTGRVSMTHNQVDGGNEVLIVNGSAGYVYKTADLSLTRITDAGYPGAKFAEYMNHTFLQIEPQGRYSFTSDLDDGLNYNALERFSGESKPDRIVGHVVANGEYQMFNERSMDHFDYVGVTGELLRNKNIPIDRGCASGASICLLDNAVFFVGDDGSGYEKRGYEMRRITTHAIEQAWARCDRSKAFAFAFEDRGYKIWYVTFPEPNGHTWGYDVSTRLWHRRESYGMKRWRLATLFKSNGRWFGGEYNSGRLFRLDWDYMLEGSDPLIRRRRQGVGHDNQNLMLLEQVEYVFDTGGPETVATSVLPLQFDLTPVTVDGLTIGGALPDGAVGDTVNFRYATIGGVGEVTITLTAGSVPAGTVFAAGGITGAYTTAEHDNAWTVTATDSEGNTAVLPEVQYVLDQLGDPPDAGTLEAYSYALSGTEGEPPYEFELTDGALPPGLSLSSAGLISGTTGASAGAYEFSVNMTDDAGVDKEDDYTILIDLVPIYLIVGAGGGIAVSPDAVTWTSKTSGTTDTLLAVTYGEGLYVAVGAGGRTVTSPDTDTWTIRTNPASNSLASICYGNGTFVAASTAPGLSDGEIVYSLDGITWTLASPPAGFGSIGEVIFANSQFIAVSANATRKTMISSDGITWTQYANGGGFYGVDWTGTQYVSVGQSAETYTSNDAQTWTYVSAQGGVNYSFLGVTHGSGKLIAAANGTGAYCGVYTSLDGAVWTRVGAAGALMSDVASAGVLHLAGGGGGVYTSVDAVTWTLQTTPFGPEGIYAGLI